MKHATSLYMLSLAFMNPLSFESTFVHTITRYLHETKTAHLSWSSQARGYFLSDEITKNIEDKITQDESSWRQPGEHSSGPLSCYDSADNKERKKRSLELAKQIGTEGQNIAGAWPINLDFPSFALIGPRVTEELISNLKNLDVELTNDQINWLNLKN